ncbi:MAG: DUF1207 domain-containing protein [Parachlamydiaceae bacterium]
MKKILLTILCAFPLLLNAEISNSAEFMRGYLSSKIEDRYSNDQIELDVIDQEIVIYNWPAEINSTDMKIFLEECCPNFRVRFGNPTPFSKEECPDTYVFACPRLAIEEQLLPELNPFFPTMLAQPHIFGYSIGYRSYDKIFKSSIPVSIGDQFSLFQIKNLLHGRLYFGIEACVWARFDARTKSLSLINADYFISLPFTYFNDRFSMRLRIFHQSSHLGDEFLLENPQILRVNPSMEVVDLSLAYEPIDKLQVFLGYSRVLRSDDSFKVKPNNIYYGFNYFFDFATIQMFNVEAFPYLAAYFTNEENTNWGLNSSVAIGYQWDKSYGRKLRLYLMGHVGYSAEGQFAKKKSKYISLNLLYGY